MTPFWDVLVVGENMRRSSMPDVRNSGFCMAATGRAPKNWFDVQLAAGMIGLEYPISYGKLLQKMLGKTLAKGETRTDWRRRPLTDGQLEYALQDVIYLPEVRGLLGKRLGRARPNRVAGDGDQGLAGRRQRNGNEGTLAASFRGIETAEDGAARYPGIVAMEGGRSTAKKYPSQTCSP